MNFQIISLSDNAYSFSNIQSRYTINTVTHDARFPDGHPVLMEQTQVLNTRRAAGHLKIYSIDQANLFFEQVKAGDFLNTDGTVVDYNELIKETKFKLLKAYLDRQKAETAPKRSHTSKSKQEA